MKNSFVIAIDGTAASGKGTLARALAKDLGFAWLDTGRLYRYVGYALILAGEDPADERLAVDAANALKMNLRPEDLQNQALASDEAGSAASVVAAIPGVRAALLEFQRGFAASPPDGAKGAVLDGRDIGTVVCPDADLKFYVDADPAIRAERRRKELHSKGISVTYDAVLADMQTRDQRDASRATAPMKPADDAVMLDTSELTADETLRQARAVVRQRLEI